MVLKRFGGTLFATNVPPKRLNMVLKRFGGTLVANNVNKIL